MEKLDSIQLSNTIAVKVDCSINEEIVAENFKIIMEALRQLQQDQN